MLFKLDLTDPASVGIVKGTTLADVGWKEKDLEDLVAGNIDRIVRETQLFVIAQQRQYQEEPDILALDRGGDLHIFELKRWKSEEENLLQVLRYGQKFGQHEYADLRYLFSRYAARAGKQSTPDQPDALAKAHAKYFDLPEPLPWSSFNTKQHFVVMTNGLDRGTREAIAYWGSQGLPVKPLVYRVYQMSGGDTVLEIEPYGPEGDAPEDQEDGLFVVNTNVAYMPDAYREMLTEKKAAAYYGRKRAIEKVRRGSSVALYHSGVGVVALGKTTGDVRRIAVGDDADKEYHVPCDFEYVVDPETSPEKAVTASSINEHLNSKHRFRQTIYTLPAEVIDFIREQLKSNGASREFHHEVAQ